GVEQDAHDLHDGPAADRRRAAFQIDGLVGEGVDEGSGRAERRAHREDKHHGCRGGPGVVAHDLLPTRPARDARAAGQTRRRAVAQRESSWRLESWSLRSTDETWVSTVLTEMNSSLAIS